MWLFLSIASAVVFGSAGWFMKMSQMKGGSVSVLLLWLYIIGTVGFGVHTLLESSLDQLQHMQVWLAGLCIGAGSAIGNYLFMKALELGPASLTSPLSNSNIVLVVFMGVWFYGETLGIFQFISIALLLAATIFIAQKKENKSINSHWWYTFVLFAIIMFAIRNGGLKVTAELGYAAAPVLFVAYFISILFFIVPVLKQYKSYRSSINEHSISTQRAASIGITFGILSGLCSYGGMQLYAVALEHGPASLVAPIFATNGLLVSILSILIYRERLNRLQWISFALLLLGLIFIRID